MRRSDVRFSQETVQIEGQIGMLFQIESGIREYVYDVDGPEFLKS